ncbi:hypothetical protein FQN54_009199 [Arachnomyces sp. PD_36]|nr:hypothetical protein FQN54_009199 [Arachnomyces sp. PD_36]
MCTGTGLWPIEFADQHPSSSIIGTELSAIQPTCVPPNVQFEIDDCEDEWLYAENSFDFIHVRGLYGCVADWDRFYEQAFRHLKPGGYIEQVEQSVVPKSDDGTTDGTVFEKWGQVSLEAGDAFGKSLRMAEEAASKIAQAGFVDVVEKRFKCPIGPWPKDRRLKELGLYNRLNWEEGIEGWTLMLLTKILEWKQTEVERYLAEMRKALWNPNIHAYQKMYGKPKKASRGREHVNPVRPLNFLPDLESETLLIFNSLISRTVVYARKPLAPTSDPQKH